MATILIVEENRTLAGFEARILREAGHTTILAADARSALLEAAAGPDLILLALGLPDLPGAEVLRRLKSQPETARIPVLVITGLTEDAAQLRTTARGMVVDILLKPVSSSRLRELVEAALADRPAQAADVQAQAHQHQRELIGQLIVEGSDALVFHVHRRLCADRTRRRRSSTSADPLTWTEIAEWGKHELLLDAEQARLLRRRQSSAPWAARRDTP
jgi:DNA-binding response OmpR family regulator